MLFAGCSRIGGGLPWLLAKSAPRTMVLSSSVCSQGDATREAAVASSNRLKCRVRAGLGCHEHGGGMRRRWEASLRLPGTRLPWSLLRREISLLCPVGQLHRGTVGDFTAQKAHCILPALEWCLSHKFPRRGISKVLSSLGGNLDILRTFYCIPLFFFFC